MMKTKLLFAWGFCLLLSQLHAQYCTDDNRFSQTPVFSIAQIDYDTAVVYGNALNYQGANQDLLLNICFPDMAVDTMSKRPLIILMHGGGFLVGGRNDMNSLCLEFAQRGYVAATIGYRLGWDSGTSGCDGDTISNVKAVYRGFQDAHAALRYLVANASVYGIDTAWIFSGGESAGGVNSLNLAFVDQVEMNARYPFLEPELGSINGSGNALTNTFSLKAIFNNWGSMFDPELLTAADAIPMIAFHGDMDDCLPLDTGTYSNCPDYVTMYGSRVIYNKLQGFGVCAELNIKQGGDHGIYDETAAQDVYRVSRACCFIKSLFCGSCTSAYLTDSVATDCSLTGVDDEEALHALRLYPNPCQGSFVLEWNDEAQTVERVAVYNLLGELVYAADAARQSMSMRIHLAHAPKGMYVVIIQYASASIQQKLLVE